MSIQIETDFLPQEVNQWSETETNQTNKAPPETIYAS